MTTRLQPVPVGLLIIGLSMAANAARAVDVDPAAVDRARDAFVAQMVEEHGFDAGELAAILERAEIEQSILEAISRPAERVLTWHEYRNIFLTDTRIDGGVEFWQQHAGEIAQASESFGVAPELLVAILGVETNYGRRMGSYRVIDALATLAFAYPPRSGFFSSELEAFFLLAREEGMDPETLLGSYAGGHGRWPVHFVKLSRLRRGRQRRRHSRPLGRIGKTYLPALQITSRPTAGGQAKRWFERAMLGNGRAPGEASNSMDLNDTLTSVRAAGYEVSAGLPEETPVTLLSLEGEDGQEYWVGFHNFRVITRYNRSVMYALAVHQLARTILAGVEQLGLDRATDEGA